jgi:hypothetical protein
MYKLVSSLTKRFIDILKSKKDRCNPFGAEAN